VSSAGRGKARFGCTIAPGGGVAQRLEHGSYTAPVGGSNPPSPTSSVGVTQPPSAWRDPRAAGIILGMTSQVDSARVQIRPATAADLSMLVDFRIAMFADMFAREHGSEAPRPEDPALRTANERWLDEHLGRDYLGWVAELDGRPVATAGLLWFAHPPGHVNVGGVEAYILNVYTRPEARRMGLAQALMERVVEEARAAGVRRIWLRASDEGRPLYEAMGFRTGRYLELMPD
jgi:ribosomal protein S18 acetylase RimI-like enzyme